MVVDVQVHQLSGSAGSDADLRLGRIHASTRSFPCGRPRQAIPGRGRRDDLADSLGVKGESTDGHVAMVRALGQRGHGLDLLGGESRRSTARAAGLIVELTAGVALAPAVASRWGDVSDSQRGFER